MSQQPSLRLSTSNIEELLARAARHLEVGAYRDAHAACLEVLKRAPDTAEAFYLLGVLTSEHNNHVKARELFERTLSLAPTHHACLAWLARTYIALNMRSEALDAAEQAAKHSPLGHQTLNTIGVVFSRAGVHDRAVPFYEEATKSAPHIAEYWYNLGSAQQFVGDLDQARSAFQKAIALEPDHAKSWSSLISVAKQTTENNSVADLEELFQSLKTADDRLLIGHALAKVYEDLGDAENAMAWLSHAKKSKREQLRYNFQNDQVLFEAATTSIRATYKKGFEEPGAIFIVGLPRTGTTLIDRIVSSHPDVASAGELTDFGLNLKQFTKTSSPYVLDSETLQKATTVDMVQLGRAYMKSARRLVGNVPYFIDKMPLNFFYAPLIISALPNARIICVRRDPADSMLSNYRQLFATSFSYYNYSHDLQDTARYVNAFNRLVDGFTDTLHSQRYTEVFYEQVIDDLEGEARRLTAFCGLSWDPACLSFHTNAAPVATASSAQVRQPLYSTSVGRWRRYAPYMRDALAILGRE